MFRAREGGLRHFVVLNAIWVIAVWTLVSTWMAVGSVTGWIGGRHPQKTTLRDYLQRQSQAEWLELQEVHLRLDGAIVMGDPQTGRRDHLWVPAWPTDDVSQPVQALVEIGNERLPVIQSGDASHW